MSAIKKSSNIVLCVVLAVVCLMGVLTILNTSSVQARRSLISRPSNAPKSTVVISPTMLQASLYPNTQIGTPLWITNTSESPITFTIYEMSAALNTAGSRIMPVSTPVVESSAQSQISSNGSAMVVIYLREIPDLTPAYNIPDRDARRQYVYQRLLEAASHSQGLFEWLEKQAARPQRLLTAYAIAARLDATQLKIVAAHPQVKRIGSVHQYQISPGVLATHHPTLLPLTPENQRNSVEWNIAKIRADETWGTFGIRGEGAVVGIVGTGVMYDHSALINAYRGNLGADSFDHNYNWYDFVSGQPEPYDDGGHGTMLTGIVSGDDGAGNQIGVAPEAQWIAVKACTGGFSCSEIDLHAALEWMLAPRDLSDSNPDPTKAPDVLLNGWGFGGCNGDFQADLVVLRAAGILPIFPPGGGGPACSSIGSPASLPEALSAGATDVSDAIASFSARGPASCNPGEVKPDLSAPGVDILTSYIGPDYIHTDGTSWSTAHAAGTAALIISADPSAGPDTVEQILYRTAACRQDLSCGGDSCPGANHVYGHGRIDAFEAVSATLGSLSPFNLPWLGESPISGTLAAGEGIAVQVSFDSTGLEPGTYSGALGIATSDPITPFLSVPVTLHVIDLPVGPRLEINPLSFSLTLPISSTQNEQLTISNTGDSPLTFTLYEVTSTQLLLHPQVQLVMPDTEPIAETATTRVDAPAQTQLLFLGKARLMLYLRGQTDLAAAYSIADRETRGQYVYDRLLETARLSNDLYDWLVRQGTQPRRLLTANAIAATLDQAQLDAVLGFPQVVRVGTNQDVEIIRETQAPNSSQMTTNSKTSQVEWNIAKIRADEAWATFGIRGTGAVVGIVDTGVMYDHPALVSSYRGNTGDNNFDHNYNWFDFFSSQPVPYDDNGHGTMGTGIVVGDGGPGNQIGVAPGARWIAYRALNAGGGTVESLHAGLEWMLAPTDLSGNNPDPKLAPHVVLNMWRFNACDQSFNQDLNALRAANILPVFAPGSDGPGCALVAYPAASPMALSAGATDYQDIISNYSARGPSCIDGSTKPDLAAPGVNIRSSSNDGQYQEWSGTSFSTAHLAGAAALLFSADANISIAELEQTLFNTAVCHDEEMTCGGKQCPGANNAYGYGRIDVFEAVSYTMGTNPPYDLPWLQIGPIAGELPPGQRFNFTVFFNTTTVQPGEYHGGIGIESNDPYAPFTVLPVKLIVEQRAIRQYMLPLVHR